MSPELSGSSTCSTEDAGSGDDGSMKKHLHEQILLPKADPSHFYGGHAHSLVTYPHSIPGHESKIDGDYLRHVVCRASDVHNYQHDICHFAQPVPASTYCESNREVISAPAPAADGVDGLLLLSACAGVQREDDMHTARQYADCPLATVALQGIIPPDKSYGRIPSMKILA